MAKAGSLQNALWDKARRAAEANPSPVPSGMFVQATNDLIDSFGRRDAALHRHVPEVVLFLLLGTFLITSAIVGFSGGVIGRRPPLVSFAMVVLIVVLVFVILDLDRPIRGLIMVSEKNLLDLQASMKAEGAAAGRPALPARTGTCARARAGSPGPSPSARQNATPSEATKTWSLEPGLNQKPPRVTRFHVSCANGPRWMSRSPP